MKMDLMALRIKLPFDENSQPIHWHWNVDRKNDIMLNAHLGLASPATIAAHAEINTPGLNSENSDGAARRIGGDIGKK